MCIHYQNYIVFNAGIFQCTGKVNFLFPIPSSLISLPHESNVASKVINHILNYIVCLLLKLGTCSPHACTIAMFALILPRVLTAHRGCNWWKEILILGLKVTVVLRQENSFAFCVCVANGHTTVHSTDFMTPRNNCVKYNLVHKIQPIHGLRECKNL